MLEMTIGQANRKAEEIEAGVTEGDNVLTNTSNNTEQKLKLKNTISTNALQAEELRYRNSC